MEDDFYATIKLKNGEEIFSKVMPCFENNKTILIITNPTVVSEVIIGPGEIGYKLESWLKTTKEDMFIINMDDVLTLNESKDIKMILVYQSWIRNSVPFKSKENKYGIRKKLNRKMGYISSVNDAKDILEKLYNNS